ncbi:MAG: hypothetical protein KDC87_15540 [Planctomycetes bacterium]|nr:hypothetical protein [Planctomycetota bacterium]
MLRIAILGALALVLWGYGPRAWARVAARLGVSTPRISVDLDKVGLERAPEWLRSDPVLVRAVLYELSPSLRGRIDHGDEATAERLARQLEQLAWVRAVQVRREHPARFQLAFDLERPVLEVVATGPIAGRVASVLVTATGHCLPKAPGDGPSALPRCPLHDGPQDGMLPLWLPGRPHPDPRVVAAAGVAQEWRDKLAPQVPDAPALCEVDAGNLGYRLFADRRTAEVRVGLRRPDGVVARFDYGHPPDQPLPRVDIADKVRVFRAILQQHPRLAGVDSGDLRFVNLWQSWLRPQMVKK